MTPTLVLVDAGMVAGFRRSSLSLGQLHQALVHLARQHPEAQVAVVADPSLKWDLAPADQPLFEGDIIAQAIVCAPAGALDGTIGFLERAAASATSAGYASWRSPIEPSRGGAGPAAQRGRQVGLGPRRRAHDRGRRRRHGLRPAEAPPPLAPVKPTLAAVVVAAVLLAGPAGCPPRTGPRPRPRPRLLHRGRPDRPR